MTIPEGTSSIKVFLSSELKEKLADISKQTGQSLSSLVLAAVREKYLGVTRESLEQQLQQLATQVSAQEQRIASLELLQATQSHTRDTPAINIYEDTISPNMISFQELADRLRANLDPLDSKAIPANLKRVNLKKIASWTSGYDPDGIHWEPADPERKYWVPLG